MFTCQLVKKVILADTALLFVLPTVTRVETRTDCVHVKPDGLVLIVQKVRGLESHLRYIVK